MSEPDGGGGRGGDRLRGLRYGPVAESYDRVRPGYPDALFADLVEMAGLGPGCRVVEVGAGTGKGTAGLAARGASVEAVEPDPAMAEVLRARVPGVRVVVCLFEDFEPSGPVDLVASAQAWHWMPREALDKAAAVLAPGGLLALWWNWAGSLPEPLHSQLREVARSYVPEAKGEQAARIRSGLTAVAGDVEAHRAFGDLVQREHSHERTYSAADYVDLVSTESSVRALEPGREQALRSDLARVLRAHGGGPVTVPLTCHLLLAARLA